MGQPATSIVSTGAGSLGVVIEKLLQARHGGRGTRPSRRSRRCHQATYGTTVLEGLAQADRPSERTFVLVQKPSPKDLGENLAELEASLSRPRGHRADRPIRRSFAKTSRRSWTSQRSISRLSPISNPGPSSRDSLCPSGKRPACVKSPSGLAHFGTRAADRGERRRPRSPARTGDRYRPRELHESARRTPSG